MYNESLKEAGALFVSEIWQYVEKQPFYDGINAAAKNSRKDSPANQHRLS